MEDENATVANQRLVHSVTVRNSQKNGGPGIARSVGGPDQGGGLMHQGRTLICLLPSNQIKPNQGENIIDD